MSNDEQDISKKEKGDISEEKLSLAQKQASSPVLFAKKQHPPLIRNSPNEGNEFGQGGSFIKILHEKRLDRQVSLPVLSSYRIGNNSAEKNDSIPMRNSNNINANSNNNANNNNNNNDNNLNAKKIPSREAGKSVGVKISAPSLQQDTKPRVKKQEKRKLTSKSENFISKDDVLLSRPKTMTHNPLSPQLNAIPDQKPKKISQSTLRNQSGVKKKQSKDKTKTVKPKIVLDPNLFVPVDQEAKRKRKNETQIQRGFVSLTHDNAQNMISLPLNDLKTLKLNNNNNDNLNEESTSPTVDERPILREDGSITPTSLKRNPMIRNIDRNTRISRRLSKNLTSSAVKVNCLLENRPTPDSLPQNIFPPYSSPRLPAISQIVVWTSKVILREEWDDSLLLDDENTLICRDIRKDGYHIEAGHPSIPSTPISPLELNELLPSHVNYFQILLDSGSKIVHYYGVCDDDPKSAMVGPIILSMEICSSKKFQRVIIRSPKGDERKLVPGSSSSKVLKEIYNQTPSLRMLKLCKVKNEALEKWTTSVAKFDSSQIVTNYKFGVLSVKEHQTVEDEFYNNDEISVDFEEFLQFLGEKITLSGWDKFRGGLDVSGDNSTGKYSVYTVHKNYEIMFHIAQYLPFFEKDPQQVERKRHLGNDVVVIIFKEDSKYYRPTSLQRERNEQRSETNDSSNNNNDSDINNCSSSSNDNDDDNNNGNSEQNGNDENKEMDCDNQTEEIKSQDTSNCNNNNNNNDDDDENKKLNDSSLNSSNFQCGDKEKWEFNPLNIKSQFNHVFFVVSKVYDDDCNDGKMDNSNSSNNNHNNNNNLEENSDNDNNNNQIGDNQIKESGDVNVEKKVKYRVEMCCKPDVSPFLPTISFPNVYERTDLTREFFLTKLINAERAAMFAKDFRLKLSRTRKVLLQDIIDLHS